MDDLMNKVGALIEEHVKSEVEARREHFENMTWEREEVRKILNAGVREPIEEAAARVARHRDALLVDNAALRDQPSRDEIRRGARALGFWEKLVETLCVGPADEDTFDNVMEKIRKLRWNACFEKERADGNFDAWGKAKAERDNYRAMWEQLHKAQGEDINAKEQLKELLSTLGLSHFDSATVSEAVRRTREYDRKQRETIKRLDEEVAASLRERQKTLAKVRELEAQLLEVRKAVGEKAPAESAKAPPKQSEFQVGDLVARHPRGPGCWGKVHAVDGDYVQVSYPAVGEGLYWHMERELTRKPVEHGDRVRITGELSKGSPFAGRIGTARAKELGGLYGEWRIAKPEGGHFATCAKLVVAIAP